MDDLYKVVSKAATDVAANKIDEMLSRKNFEYEIKSKAAQGLRSVRVEFDDVPEILDSGGCTEFISDGVRKLIGEGFRIDVAVRYFLEGTVVSVDIQWDYLIGDV